MIVREELSIAVADDIPLYALAHRVRRLVTDAVRAAAPRAGRPSELNAVARTGIGLTVLVVEALCAADFEREIERLRHADCVLELLRHDAWRMLCSDELSAPMFDDIMVASARCRDEVRAALATAGHRAWAALHGLPAPAARRRR